MIKTFTTITIIFIVSIFITALYKIYENSPEWFPYAEYLFSFANIISLGIISAYPFYIITFHIPRKNWTKRQQKQIIELSSKIEVNLDMLSRIISDQETNLILFPNHLSEIYPYNKRKKLSICCKAIQELNGKILELHSMNAEVIDSIIPQISLRDLSRARDLLNLLIENINNTDNLKWLSDNSIFDSVNDDYYNFRKHLLNSKTKLNCLHLEKVDKLKRKIQKYAPNSKLQMLVKEFNEYKQQHDQV